MGGFTNTALRSEEERLALVFKRDTVKNKGVIMWQALCDFSIENDALEITAREVGAKTVDAAYLLTFLINFLLARRDGEKRRFLGKVIPTHPLNKGITVFKTDRKVGNFYRNQLTLLQGQNSRFSKYSLPDSTSRK